MRRIPWLILLALGVAFANPQELLENARDLEQKGLISQAYTLLHQALKENPKKDVRFEILTELAALELSKDPVKNPDSALVHLMQAKSLYGENYRKMDRVYYLLGLTYMELGRYVDAARAFETVATRFPKSPYFEDALDGVEEAFKKNFKEVEAIAGDVPITKVEVDARIEEMPPLFRGKYETPEGRKQLLDRMIDEILMTKEAEARKLDLKQGVRQQLKRARAQILQRALYEEEVRNKVQISDSDIEKYYRQHKDEFKVPARADIRRIVVDTRDEAEEILRLLRQGAPFDSLAKARSKAPEAVNGGLIRGFTPSTKPDEIAKVVFRMKEGQISDIIPLKDGKFAIVKLEKLTPESYRPLKAVRHTIENKLRREAEKKRWEAFRQELRKKYGVKYQSDLAKQAQELEQRFGIQLQDTTGGTPKENGQK